jgi:2Fe-2S ferredoxin
MPKVTYRAADGGERTLDVAVGLSVMEGAMRNDVEGIVAECGGSCMCATCHVYVDEAFTERMPSPSEEESEMLEEVVAERRPNSRLSCQLLITPELDGLLVHLPERQT